jgi:hypothetical protein
MIMPGKPVLLSPENGESLTQLVSFSWQIGSNADNHRIEIDNDANWANGVHENVILGPLDDSYSTALPYGTYRWRVWAINATGENCSENTWMLRVVAFWRNLESWTSVTRSEALAWRLEEGWTAAASSEALAWSLAEAWAGCAKPIETAWRLAEGWSIGAASPAVWKAVEALGVEARAPPLPPTLVSPADGENLNVAELRWENSQPADNFWIQIDNDADFGSPENDVEGILSSPYTPSGLWDGVWHWRVKMLKGGTSSDWSASRSFRLDTLAPAPPTPTWPPDQSSLNDPTPGLDWELPAENSYPLLSNVEVSPDKTSILENSGWISGNDWVVESPLPDNLYYWRVCVRDNAGNVSDFCEWQEFRLDTIEPNTSLTPYSPDPTTDTTPTYHGTASDNATPVIYVQYRVDGSEDWIDVPVTPGLSVEFNFTLTLSAGVHLIEVRARDEAGNWETTYASDEITIEIPAPPPRDTTPPPAPTLVSPEENENLDDNTPSFAWTSVSDPSGVSYELQVDNDLDFENLVLLKLGLKSSVYTLTNDEALPNGVYCWRVRAWDGAGNLSGWSEARSFRVRVTLPSVLSVAPSPGATGIVKDQLIVVIFSEPMDNLAPTLIQTSGTPVAYTFLGWSSTNLDNDTASWAHGDWRGGEPITLRIENYRDLAWNAGEAYTWSFETLKLVPTFTLVLPEEVTGPWVEVKIIVSNPTDEPIAKQLELCFADTVENIWVSVGSQETKEIVVMLDVTGLSGTQTVTLIDVEEERELASGRVSIPAEIIVPPVLPPLNLILLAVGLIGVSLGIVAFLGATGKVRLPKLRRVPWRALPPPPKVRKPSLKAKSPIGRAYLSLLKPALEELSAKKRPPLKHREEPEKPIGKREEAS